MGYSFEKVTRLSVGDVFYESTQYCTLKMVVSSPPVVLEQIGHGDQVRFLAKPFNGGNARGYLMTKGLEHYGPKLYDGPAYGSVSDLKDSPIQEAPPVRGLVKEAIAALETSNRFLNRVTGKRVLTASLYVGINQRAIEALDEVLTLVGEAVK